MTGIRTERRGAVLEITLDRPKANAVDAATSRALGAAFMELRDDDELRVGLVTGAGERFFSAGWDLTAAEEDGPDPDYGPGGFMGLTELLICTSRSSARSTAWRSAGASSSPSPAT